MHAAVRVGFVVLGAAMAVYGAASLTGGWLGAPPWWERTEIRYEMEYGNVWEPGDEELLKRYTIRELRQQKLARLRYEVKVPRPGRVWWSAGVVAAGLALVAVGAWPRRRAGAAT